MPDVFLSRQPLINRQNRILANRLTLHLPAGATADDAIEALRAVSESWPRNEKPVFLRCLGGPSEPLVPGGDAPSNATFELPGKAFAGPDTAALIADLQAAQASLCLMIDEHASAALSSGLSFRFIGLDAQRLPPDRLKSMAAQTQAQGIGIAFNVADRQTFQTCIDAGLNAAATWFFKRPSGPSAKALNPGQAQIVRLLDLVRKNADVKEIEAALKQDVTLSYKLLRYINSAGFGLSCEIQSFRHAVTILGYAKLNKWLSLLLVTASKDPMAQAQMHTALCRARLMEILGHGLVDKNEYDNLFITGAFSMLETLLGVAMDKALETMNLPEAISSALLGQGGMYAPFLELAIACEGDDGDAIAAHAGSLGLSANAVNLALLQALDFAETIQI